MTQDELNEKIRARFKELPKVIQSAITSTDVEKQLRKLADTNSLHIDQWQLLENEVLLTLLGYQAPEELSANLKADLDISADMASTLAKDVSKIVFEPIRQELERELEHPEAKKESISGVEAARTQVLGQAPTANEGIAIKLPEPAHPSVAPGTPPQPPPETKVERGPASGAYKPGETSIARKVVEDDPYREPPA